MISLNEFLIKHIDNTSVELVNLIQKKGEPIISISAPEALGSLGAKVSDDWSDKFSASAGIICSTTDYKGRVVDKWMTKSGVNIGYDEEAYVKYLKFVNSLYEKREFNSMVSRKFLEEIIFNWVINTSVEGQAEKNLSTYVLEKMEENIVTRTYCFPLDNLEIHHPFSLGSVQIKYFSEADFNEMKRLNNEDFETFRDKYQGMVVVCTTQKGEKIKAEEIALERCKLVIDILKVLSPTLLLPDYELDFDIDIRATKPLKSSSYSHKHNSMADFRLNMSRVSNTTAIKHTDIERMKVYGIDTIGSFVFSNHQNNELAGMLIDSIKNFASALSNDDLHKRVAEIFTIFESLLLPSKSAHVLESLTKYGPKLIVKSPDERTILKKLIKEMYDIRCDLIHHGQRNKMKMMNLINLQLALLQLIVNLILRVGNYSTKQDVLSQIDEEINKAG